ncbi:MAG: 4-hydroxy-3-methylbut-2-enyl diphosphate reductase [Bacteroidia bacterium]|nr:4-hydroxy-3-methylbut-2-enyl diphosphate reductase [Bacteroidia bacterium]
MNIEIDSGSGFCFGVVYAIQRAEEELKKHHQLYCIGDIVHNNVEVNRMKEMGLITIEPEELRSLKNCKVLIRAHGEPPETYKIAFENNIELIDASCPVVLKLQNKIKNGFDKAVKESGQVVIYGREGHAEVNGLVGQTKGKAIVVNKIEDLKKIDFSKPVILFSQTTQSTEGFYSIRKEIEKRLAEKQGADNFSLIANDTICLQVSTRGPQLKEFARKHDVVIFVSGKKSSNGKMLFDVCRNENPNTHFVSDVEDIDYTWFAKINSAGICGATSTPRRLMEEICNEIKIRS